MRAYLDTNILAFIVGRDNGRSVCDDVGMIIYDYSTQLLTSSMCVLELVHLIQIGKVMMDGHKDIRRAADAALSKIEELGIKVMPATMAHYRTLIDLPLYDDHRDPADRLIVSQAITDHIPLISSDHKFSRYERYGLELIFNKR